MDFVSQKYWDEAYSNLSLDFHNANDPIVRLITSLIEDLQKGNVFEIGCFPGRYLKVFGEKGFILNGIDTTPRVATDLLKQFEKNQFTVGELIHGDVFNLTGKQKYDIVCSFGFIEHFSNWKDVISVHINLVKKGGIVLITVPNFKGIIPNIFHRFFDKANFQRHNVQSMNVDAWKKHIERLQCKYEVLFEGPIGNIDLWADQEQRPKWKSFLLGKIFNWVRVIRNKNLPVSKHYSPYLGLIIKIK